ncbi:uncharacterized protein LOC129601704 [Paramacrobiotus metropolitanus]|uniref:uncharacterized protein LOC129601704 n=1 Tax=Paramacrobiotus metropolitanus TaxID=2943436 RepID=UPI0024461FCD|nr:uncharacterized protein LOC129601704 [Paramacrobiotus metropolitanus]
MIFTGAASKVHILIAITLMPSAYGSFGNFDHSTMSSGAPQGEKTERSFRWRISICAMTRNPIAYTIEWIFFHYNQGVEHFLLYDDMSDNDVLTLPVLLQENGFHGLVEIYPINFLRQNRKSNHGYFDHYANQFPMIDHCTNRLRRLTEWLMIIDVDEFVYSTKHGTILKFLDHEAKSKDRIDVTAYSVLAVRFGTAGLSKDFRSRIWWDPHEQFTVLQYVPINKIKNGFPLLIDRCRFRAPHPDLEKDFQIRQTQICGNDSHLCTHAIGKSLYRPENCSAPYVHFCKNLTGRSVPLLLDDLRVDHFAWYSEEYSRGLSPSLHGHKIASYQKFDRIWFSSVLDEGKIQHIVLLLQTIDKLHPKAAPVAVSNITKELPV